MLLESKLNDLFVFVCGGLLQCFVLSNVLCEIQGMRCADEKIGVKLPANF